MRLTVNFAQSIFSGLPCPRFRTVVCTPVPLWQKGVWEMTAMLPPQKSTLILVYVDWCPIVPGKKEIICERKYCLVPNHSCGKETKFVIMKKRGGEKRDGKKEIMDHGGSGVCMPGGIGSRCKNRQGRIMESEEVEYEEKIYSFKLRRIVSWVDNKAIA